jgi:nitrogen regulatory protein PII
MNEIKAIIKPFRQEEVVNALNQLNGLGKTSASDREGRLTGVREGW